MKKIDGQPIMVVSENLSLGWARIMLELTRPGVTRIAPLTLIIKGFSQDEVIPEVLEIRVAVDRFLEAQGKRDTENVAWTIFPQRYWHLSEDDRDSFYSLFLESFEEIKEYNPRNNKRGSYFQRLIDLNGGGQGPNQIEWMITEYLNHPKSRRTSKFQATTFDPSRDYTSAGQLEFPCLQQISFVIEDDGLTLNAFYATQQIARKGYGNYLGLAQLGKFMASQMGLHFEKLSVFVGVAKMDVKKSDSQLEELLAVLKPFIDGSRVLAAST